jgi:hypothetical protein
LGLLVKVLTSIAALSLMAGCTLGDIGGNDPESNSNTGSAPLCGDNPSPGPSTIRRLTRFEYENTVRELLGLAPDVDFAAEEIAYGFDNNADALNVSPVLAEQYLDAAESLAKKADLTKIVPCDPLTLGEDACARAFIERFGARAYRRALDATEVARLVSVFQKSRDEEGFAAGIRTVLEVILQSPQLLYRIEETKSGSITPSEMASRLSFFLWGAPPDDVLLAAAKEGRLSTDDEIAAQATRMIGDPRTHKMVSRFHAQWLGLDALAHTTKTREAFPQFNDGIRDAMLEETRLFLDAVFWKEGKLEALFETPWTFVDAKLAHYYGVSVPPSSGFVKVVFPAEQRFGLLTQGSILATYAKPSETSPVARGKFVREKLLCHELQPPPMNVQLATPEAGAGTTMRERYAEHSKNPTCAGCHRYTDSIGFGFERWDAAGRFRTTEIGNRLIDATGTLTDTIDADGPFDGAIELGRKLARSEQVRSCVVTQWFRFTYGRKETPADVCTLDKLRARFAASGYDMRTLLVALTQTDAFRYRGAP